jgi:hypothetical protein
MSHDPPVGLTLGNDGHPVVDVGQLPWQEVEAIADLLYGQYGLTISIVDNDGPILTRAGIA